MKNILKYALLAIFLINNGFVGANSESNEAVAEADLLFSRSEASSCPSTGIACVPGDCCSQYRQCVGSTFYAAQDTAPGTVCKAGRIVHAHECTTPCGASSAPVTPATQAPTPATQAPTPATQAPETPSTQAPEAPAPTEAPSQGSPCRPPTKRPTSAPATAAPTSAPATAPPTAPTTRPPTAATSKPVTPTTAPTTAPTQRATVAPTRAPTTAPTTAPTQRATVAPTRAPTAAPTQRATVAPTRAPTAAPTQRATVAPTTRPSTTGGSTVGLCDIVPTSQEPLKFLVPLYVYPGSTWDAVAAGASKVPTVAIVNPASGPTAKPDSAYTSGMTKLKNAKVEMVGYVYTSWGARALSDVKRDIDTYVNNWPGINGIFFDEGSAEAKDIPFYRELYNYVTGKGYKHVILNPGTQPAQGYNDISTNIVIFEDYGTKFTGTKTYPSWVTCAPNAAAKSGYKYKFSGIAHTVSGNTASTDIIRNMQKSGLGMVYITDGAGGCCTYNTLVSYYASQATSIQSINNS